MAYSKDLIDALLKEADIVTVISSFIPVTKKGAKLCRPLSFS
jgi:DNA primase